MFDLWVKTNSLQWYFTFGGSQGMTLSMLPNLHLKRLSNYPIQMADYGINVFIFFSPKHTEKKLQLLYLLHMEVISGFFQ